MNQFHLMPQPSGHCTGYDARINPAILNEFASAAFRWHTLVHVSIIEFVDLVYCPGRVAIDEVELNHSSPSTVWQSPGQCKVSPWQVTNAFLSPSP